jgi:hypothetical protein
MDALPYVDSLIREYLLFRGFVSSLEAFSRDLDADPGCGLQVGGAAAHASADTARQVAGSAHAEASEPMLK